MKLPFSLEQFLNVFGRYNTDIWPIQIAFYGLAMAGLFVLVVNHPKKNKVINAILSFFWIWMGIVYHILYFAEINPAANFFGAVFIVQGLIFAYFGLWNRNIEYRANKSIYSAAGIILVLFSLFIYPLMSYSFGHVFPETPTFGLPCPTTIFTLGMLILSLNRLQWYIYLFPLLWSIVGVTAAINLSITEDFALGVSGAIALVFLLLKIKRPASTQPAENQHIPI